MIIRRRFGGFLEGRKAGRQVPSFSIFTFTFHPHVIIRRWSGGWWEGRKAGLLPRSLFLDKIPHFPFSLSFFYLIFNLCFSLSQVWLVVGRKEGWIVAQEPLFRQNPSFSIFTFTFYLIFNLCFSPSQVWWVVGRKEGWIVAQEPVFRQNPSFSIFTFTF